MENEHSPADVIKCGSYVNGSSHLQADSYGHQPLLAHHPVKVFKCKYCARKFLNPRALGGHQNAHKKEKTSSSSSWKRISIADDQNSSLGIQPHALLYHPIQGESSAAVQPKHGFRRFEEPWRKQVFEEATDEHGFSWGGSFYLHSTTSDANHSNSQDLDLDLHL